MIRAKGLVVAMSERDEGAAAVARGGAGSGAVWLDGRRLQRSFKRSAGLGPSTYVSALAPALDAEALPDALRVLVGSGADVVPRAPRSRFVEAPRALGASGWSTARQLALGAWLTRQRPRAVHFVAQQDAPAL